MGTSSRKSENPGYMYRPGKLEEDFRNHEAEEILGIKGYPVGNVDRCVVELVRRLNRSEAFPHEIGLFLGYPPKDVAAFILDSRIYVTRCP